ncbi:hypothetical protein RQP55_03150 [Novosphingobium sp. APW14]|uniref:hypothetical protein n=1 Tax=Novosphingobium sp. APW14 TaxID=3077237 RepID=UPI0028DECB8D|nr:hypothetical protein [Novosphingobium sp. APW14]MDT9012427.1 hypothetical protein [Novosphingobium sp. APW14]
MGKAALLTTLAALALAGCGKADDDAGRGGVSASEAKALDEAAQMLEARRLPASPAPAASNQAAPAPR